MKALLFSTLMSLSCISLATPLTLTGVIPGANILSLRALPSLNNQFDAVANLVEVATVSKHELTHVIQQRMNELNSVIDDTKNGKGDEGFKNFLNLLYKDGIKVDVNALSNYILQEAFLKDSPKLFAAAKNYGNTQSNVGSLKKTLEDLKTKSTKCEEERVCAQSELPTLKNQINQTQNDLTGKMAQMNMQFLALQEATQMESRKFQTLSNASKARHDIAMNAIRNMK
jgi:hypothetical protein